MGWFERRFVRPTHLQVVEALVQATREANEDGNLIQHDRDFWDTLLAQIRAQPEGFQQWYRNWQPRGAGVVGLAWWTDYLGRRHFRIYAGSAQDGSFNLLFCPERSPRPPVWHIAPDQVFGRHRGSGPQEWLAVCSCGTTGGPRGIGWMGTCCGFCHDHGGIGSVRENEPLPLLGSFNEARNRLTRLAFSPCGRWLVGMGSGRLVHRWDLTTKTHAGPIRPNRGDIRTLTFNGDGRLLVLTTNDRMLRFVEIGSGIEIAGFVTPFNVRHLAIAPDDLTLVLVGDQQLEVWARADRAESWLPVAGDSNPVSTVAFSTSGDRLVLGRDGSVQCFELCERGGRPLLEWDRPLSGATPVVLGFHDRNRKLALLAEQISTTSHSVDDRPNPAILQVLDTEEGRELFHRDSHVGPWETSYFHYLLFEDAPPDRQTAWRSTFQFAPSLESGENWLARCAGTALVLENLTNRRSRTQLESAGRESLTALAFAPDGQTLASADSQGTVQLWPWRRLVEA